MAADSDGGGVGAVCRVGSFKGSGVGVVVTCEGDLHDPRFPQKLRRLLNDLHHLLAQPHSDTLKVNKVEPWNSVRVTLVVPAGAAARLRALAAAGAPQLRALGILSVQLDGDAALHLRTHHGHDVRIHTAPAPSAAAASATASSATPSAPPTSSATDASTSRSQSNAELLAGLGALGKLMGEEQAAGAGVGDASPSTSAAAAAPLPHPVPPAPPTHDHFKSPNTVCPMDNKLPLLPSAAAPPNPAEFPFGSMTQARVIHRKENTLGLGGREASGFVGPPPPPYPAKAAANVAMSSPLLVNLLQNEGGGPAPRSKPQPQQPSKLERLEDGQVELAVGRAPLEYRAPPPPPQTARLAPPPPPPSAAPTPPFARRPFTQMYRPPSSPAPPNATVVTRPHQRFTAQPYQRTEFSAPAPPPPYRHQAQVRQKHVPQPQPKLAPEDLQALLPPSTASMDQKTQSSVQEFQRYQQQYNARQRAASRAAGDWAGEGLSTLNLPELPDSCDLDQLLPTLGADLNLDSALSAISELDNKLQMDGKLDGLLYEDTLNSYPTTSAHKSIDVPNAFPNVSNLHRTVSASTLTDNLPISSSSMMSPPQRVPMKSPSQSSPHLSFKSPPSIASPVCVATSSVAIGTDSLSSIIPSQPQTFPMAPPVRMAPRSAAVSTATVGSQATAQEIEEQRKLYLIKSLMRDEEPPPKELREKQQEHKEKSLEVKEKSQEIKQHSQSVQKQLEVKESKTTAHQSDIPKVENLEKSVEHSESRLSNETEDTKKSDEDPLKFKNKIRKDRDEGKVVIQKTGKLKAGTKEKPAVLKDKIVRDIKPSKMPLLQKTTIKQSITNPLESPKSPSEKESIKIKLKIDKNEPVVASVYKADVSFSSQQAKVDKCESELRVPPLHISLRGRNSAVIKSSKKDKKKVIGEPLSKKLKNRKTIGPSLSEKDTPRGETSESRPNDSEAAKKLLIDNVATIKLNNHFDAETIMKDVSGESIVYRMKSLSKNSHIVSKSTYKGYNHQLSSVDGLKLKAKKAKLFSDSDKSITLTDKLTNADRDTEWRNEVIDKEEKYGQNDGYRENVHLNNHDINKVKKLSTPERCEGEGAPPHEPPAQYSEPGAELRLQRPAPVPSATAAVVPPPHHPPPNGLLSADKKRKPTHTTCLGDGTCGACPGGAGGGAGAAGAGGLSPRRKDRPKDKSYCKLLAERRALPAEPAPLAAAPPPRSPAPPPATQGDDSGIESMDALSEKSPNQSSQSPPARKERLSMPSPASVQRIIGVEPPDIDDIEAELAKMHAEHVNGDVSTQLPKQPSPILRDRCRTEEPTAPPLPPPPLDQRDSHAPAAGSPHAAETSADNDPLPSRASPPRYTYSNPEKPRSSPQPKEDIKSDISENGDSKSECKQDVKIERLPLHKAEFPDKSLLEQLLIDIPTPEFVSKRTESPSPSTLDRIARSSVRTRSSSKLNSPADGPRTPKLSPGLKTDTRADSPVVKANCVDKPSPRLNHVPVANKLLQGGKRKRRESESSCASTISCEEGLSPARPKKKPKKPETCKPGVEGKVKGKDSDSDSDEPLIKVRGKVVKGVGGKVVCGVKAAIGEGVNTRRSVRAGAGVGAGPGAGVPAPPATVAPTAPAPASHAPPAPLLQHPAPPHHPAPLKRKTRSAVVEVGAGGRRRVSKEGK